MRRFKDPTGLGTFAVFVLIIMGATWGFGSIRDSNRNADRKEAIKQAVAEAVPKAVAENDRKSQARSIATCHRGNPTRAYLRIRAQEFTKTTTLQLSYTTKVSKFITAILDCEATVENKGEPVPLSKPIERRYIKLFKRRLVPITNGDSIIASIPFGVYFSGRYRTG